MSRLTFVLVFAIACILVCPGRSEAIRLEPTEAAAGSVVDLHFLVTSDRTGVFTKKVQVIFPSAPEFESAEASAPVGWSSSVDALVGRVTSIEYESGKLDAGQTGDFIATVAVPIVGEGATFRVLQTYSDGQVVQWSGDPVENGQNEASDPRAVQLKIRGGVATTTTVPSTTTTTVLTNPSSKSSSSFPLSAGQMLIGLGVAIFFTVMLRGRRLRRQAEK
jgi:uncharacterized protein YcnI